MHDDIDNVDNVDITDFVDSVVQKAMHTERAATLGYIHEMILMVVHDDEFPGGRAAKAGAVGALQGLADAIVGEGHMAIHKALSMEVSDA